MIRLQHLPLVGPGLHTPHIVGMNGIPKPADMETQDRLLRFDFLLKNGMFPFYTSIIIQPEVLAISFCHVNTRRMFRVNLKEVRS